jgi:hypothetical protein
MQVKWMADSRFAALQTDPVSCTEGAAVHGWVVMLAMLLRARVPLNLAPLVPPTTPPPRRQHCPPRSLRLTVASAPFLCIVQRFVRKRKAALASAPDKRFDARFGESSATGKKAKLAAPAATRPAPEVDTRFAAADSWANAGEEEEEEDGEDAEGNADMDLEDDGEEEEEGSKHGGARESVSSRLARLTAMSRGLPYDRSSGGVGSGSESEEEEEEGAVAERVAAEMEEEGGEEGPDLEDVEHTTEEGAETARLALVGCDWDHMRAVDVFATLASFAPPGAAILSVVVYPSVFGLAQMGREAVDGPSRGIFRGEGVALAREGCMTAVEEEEEEEEEAVRVGGSDSVRGPKPAKKARRKGAVTVGRQQRPGRTEEEEGDAFDPAALRAYELSRLKYYFAVITCSSPSAAAAVYASCDGLEFEASSNVLDLRFIPDGTAFTHTAPRESATSVPRDYAPPVYVTRALQSSKVELTWDGEDPNRARALEWGRVTGGGKKEKKKGKKKGGRGGEEDVERKGGLGDLRAYLASETDSESDSEGGEGGSGGKRAARKAKAARMRALLLGGGRAGAQADEGEEEDEGEESKDEGEGATAEMSFTPGTAEAQEGLGKSMRRGAGKAGGTLWEAYQAKRKEKKKEKKAAAKGARGGLEGDDFFAAAEGAGGPPAAASTADAAAERARLDMLVLGEDGEEEGRSNFDVRGMLKMGKAVDKADAKAARQARRGRSVKAGAVDDASAAVGTLAAAGKGGASSVLADARFGAVLADPSYAIDPNNPSYKPTAGMKAALQERVGSGRSRDLVMVATRQGGAGTLGSYSAKAEAAGGQDGAVAADVKRQVAALKAKFSK